MGGSRTRAYGAAGRYDSNRRRAIRRRAAAYDDRAPVAARGTRRKERGRAFVKLTLAIETSGRFSSVAIAGPRGLIGEYGEEDGGRTENVQRMIAGLFREHGREPGEIDGVAVSIGPGSFTGTRIGIAVAKGVALANACPLVGVPVPHALATEADPEREYEVWLDVGRGEVYRTLVRGASTLVSGRTAPVDDYLAEDRGPDAPRLIGSGADRYRERIAERWPGCPVAETNASQSRARTIARIGRALLLAGEGGEWRGLEPLYARPADARLPKGRPAAPGKGAR
ncbi:MAG: tRNA (adenosine(37)-N6)-threonylcarbamoyltransferase complex dimerization subunit type 1 TsaB [Gemmatimonadetes bacterium]|nr:tRNA (adenosine(37)-N6)-threonylcarbamoyltransferase complex dimerization subunit type 1 TsaB [Gemmatimonadota bacterium]